MKRLPLLLPLLALCALALPASAAKTAEKISKVSQATMHNSNGTLIGDGTGGFSGGDGIGGLFDGIFDNGIHFGRTGNGGYCQVCFTNDVADGYYVTEIKIGETAGFAYTLEYSDDGTTWKSVEDATNVSKVGTYTYGVNAVAKMIRCVLVESPGWGSGLAEIEVWGMDPADISCTHPEYTAWTFVAGSATCTQPGIEERFCTTCNERFTRDSELPPLGHDCISHLQKSGTASSYGSGTITCSRCDFQLDMNVPIDLVSTIVNGMAIGRIAAVGHVNFTDVSVSSTGDIGYGQSPQKLIDGNWTSTWGAYWYAAGNDTDQRIDIVFCTMIDLTMVDISLPNINHITHFFSVDDATGEETEIGSVSIVKDNSLAGDNEQYQRTQVFFFGNGETTGSPVKHLRIRQSGANAAMRVCEVHPYGTVVGAGKLNPGPPMFILMQ